LDQARKRETAGEKRGAAFYRNQALMVRKLRRGNANETEMSPRNGPESTPQRQAQNKDGNDEMQNAKRWKEPS
jgi:hypothetical protein